MSKLIVREAEIKDISRMAELDRQCFAMPWSEEDFRKEIEENPRAFYIVAEADEQVVGYAGLWVIPDEGHITNVAVCPLHRGKKIGTAIISTLIETCELSGIKEFTLEVRKSNVAAIKLYENHGFKEAGLRKGYYLDNGEDALIMWRKGDYSDL